MIKFTGFMFVGLLVTLAAHSAPAPSDLSWTAPSTRVDGTPLAVEEIKEYRVYYTIDGTPPGDGDHKASLAGKLRPSYCSWRSVIERCYSKKNLARNPTYKGCLVHPSWLNFQVFADWYEKEPNSGNLGFDLDKDLRLGGNKVYGPDTCSFVPEQINTLLNNCGSSRGLLPQGVRASGKKFEAILRVKGNHTYLGVYETAAIAHEVYKKAKSDNVKSMAEQWRDHIHPEVYDYLKSWTLV